MPPIHEAQTAGAKSLRQIATALNGRGMITSRRKLNFSARKGAGSRSGRPFLWTCVAPEENAHAVQSETIFPGVIFKPIDEPNAWVRVHLACVSEAEDPSVGRFVALVRDVARVRCLLP